MKVLVVGGTRLSGVHLVKSLLNSGHSVTIATRGITKDSFGKSVNRKIIDRKNPQSLKGVFGGEHYDAVVDNLAFSSNDVKNLLDSITTDRYVMTSSVSVYDDLHLNLREEEVDAAKLMLRWCNYEDCGYAEGKRQAEAALLQHYSDLSSVAVRFPWIFGIDDYTKRLYFYIDHILRRVPMNIDNIGEELAFISSHDAGKFLAWCVESDIVGAVNAGSIGTISLQQIIDYTQSKAGVRAMLDKSGENGTLNGAESFSLNLSKAAIKGYKFEKISDWINTTLDYWIEGNS